MYRAEQGREGRDIPWRAEAPECGFPGPMAMEVPWRQPWRGGKRRCPRGRSTASAWALVPLGQTFRWSLLAATEHLGPPQQRFWEWARSCQGLEGFRDRGVWVVILGKWGPGGTCLPACTLMPSPEGKMMLRVGKGQVWGQGQASTQPWQGWLSQLPTYKDKSKKTPFVFWFETTPHYVFSQSLAGEGPHPVIISRHWCNSNNIDCRLYRNSPGAFIFSPSNLLMTALVVNTVVRNDFKRFPWGIITFLPPECLPTLVTNTLQRWRHIFPFLIVSLLCAFW